MLYVGFGCLYCLEVGCCVCDVNYGVDFVSLMYSVLFLTPLVPLFPNVYGSFSVGVGMHWFL